MEFCEGARWLVPEGELQKRKEKGSLSSTVVVRIRGGDVAGQLCRTGLWVHQQKNCPAPCCILFAPSPGRSRRL